jgi:predicted nuclease of predicted toxin-antitoxin system
MTTIWIDAHLSPAIATWITDTFGITALALRDLGLRDAEDPEIFEAAKIQGVIFMTKDSDFVDLVERLGSPPQIIWLTCGNTSNARLREILSSVLPETLERICEENFKSEKRHFIIKNGVFGGSFA